jgi:hypothetical protein
VPYHKRTRYQAMFTLCLRKISVFWPCLDSVRELAVFGYTPTFHSYYTVLHSVYTGKKKPSPPYCTYVHVSVLPCRAMGSALVNVFDRFERTNWGYWSVFLGRHSICDPFNACQLTPSSRPLQQAQPTMHNVLFPHSDHKVDTCTNICVRVASTRAT